MYTHLFHDPSREGLIVDRTEIRMIALNEDEPFVDVQVPIVLDQTEAVFVAYDLVGERVSGLATLYGPNAMIN